MSAPESIPPDSPLDADSRSIRLKELAALFFRLGATAFGGPAVHIAMMEDEVVRQRGWMTHRRFLDLIAATNLIPGPNSTEMAIHIGYDRAGWPGLAVAGLAFIIPAVLIVLGLSAAYVTWGDLPETGWILYGVKPVLAAVILQAIWAMGRAAIRSMTLALAGAVSFLMCLAGINEILLLVTIGTALLALEGFRSKQPPASSQDSRLNSPVPCTLLAILMAGSATIAAITPEKLFWFFAKTGSVLYGSGYVLFAFIQNELVNRLGWMTSDELLDAMAIGQLTPGPLFTTATFIGYVLGAKAGTGTLLTALSATAGIFLPAFFFVAVTGPWVHRLRGSRLMGSFLDGVVVASLALMLAVAVSLAGTALGDPYTAAIATVSIVLLVRFHINSTWLIAGGAALGWVMKAWVG
ncbi:MAG: chromate efflux transporter [Deltaproteobacteria bacterium]|nr:chromate efflux transporter [Deltaproteobacteria bacterium]